MIATSVDGASLLRCGVWLARVIVAPNVIAVGKNAANDRLRVYCGGYRFVYAQRKLRVQLPAALT